MVILIQAQRWEGATTIPQGSRLQAKPKRTAPRTGDDIVWSFRKRKEVERKRHHRNINGKHIVGITPEFDLEDRWTGFSGGHTSTGWNEASGRYVELQDEFYTPDVWRAQSVSNKQASEGQIEDQTAAADAYTTGLRASYDAYKQLRELGVAKEQARGILPQSIYTQWIWTGSLQAFLHVVELRAKPDAQYETQLYGYAVRDIVNSVFPVCLEKWEARKGAH